MKVNVYLNQIEIKNEASKSVQSTNHAVSIEKVSFSWGLQTMDIDEEFRKRADNLKKTKVSEKAKKR